MWRLLIVEIVVFILLRRVDVFVVVKMLVDIILRFVVLKLLIFVVVNVWVDRFIEIVCLEFVFIKKLVENIFERILILVNLVVVVICEILVFNVEIFFCSVVWLVELLILFCDWIVNVWICCRVVVVLVIVFLVVCVSEILLLVFCIVWFKFWICEVIWLVICSFVVLFVVLLILKLDERCLNVVFKLLLVVNNWCCVFKDDMLVLINRFMGFF